MGFEPTTFCRAAVVGLPRKARVAAPLSGIQRSPRLTKRRPDHCVLRRMLGDLGTRTTD